ncbi:MAG: DUF3426 domain-containing protein [Alphaproteobacteria bacterium]
MIVTCPACQTRFRLDERAVGPSGRRLKCGRCQHVWRYTPPDGGEGAAAAEQAAADLDLDRRADREIVPAGRRARGAMPDEPPFLKADKSAGAMTAGWVLLAVTVLGLVAGLFFLQDGIVANWPQAERAYAALGLSNQVTTDGFELRDVSTRHTEVNGAPALEVSGQLINNSGAVRRPPLLRVVVQDETGRAIREWTVSVANTRLLPGEAADFSSALENPPAGAANLTFYLVAAK